MTVGLLWAEKILEVLHRHEVDYLVIGALGATLLGSPLRTDDLDICPNDDPDNLDRLGAALKEMNATEYDPRTREFFPREWSRETLEVDTTWILGTDFGPLDLVFVPAGSSGFVDLTKDAEVVKVAGINVRVAALADIIRTKEAAGRDKDRIQLPMLRKLLDTLNEAKLRLRDK